MPTTERAAPLDPEAEIGRLYGLPPERFTAARDDLAKRLRRSGAGAAAGAVKALRRPTVAAWAVNRLAREQPDALEELLDAGRRLAEAQDQAIADGAGRALREAATRRRKALDRAVAAAAGLLVDSGRKPEPHLTGIRATLETASVDEEAATAVRQARLAAELDAPSGFGLLGFAPAPARPKPKPPPAPEQPVVKPDNALGRAERELAAATQAAVEAREAAGEQEDDARDKARLARVTARAVTRAERDATKAARVAEEAERVAAEAVARAEASRAEADRAEADATAARDEAATAESEAESARAAAERAREAAAKAEADAEKAARRVARLKR